MWENDEEHDEDHPHEPFPALPNVSSSADGAADDENERDEELWAKLPTVRRGRGAVLGERPNPPAHAGGCDGGAATDAGEGDEGDDDS